MSIDNLVVKSEEFGKVTFFNDSFKIASHKYNDKYSFFIPMKPINLNLDRFRKDVMNYIRLNGFSADFALPIENNDGLCLFNLKRLSKYA